MRYLSIIFLILSFLTPVSAETDAEFYLRKGKIELENEMYDFAMENLSLSFRCDPDLYETSALLGDLFLHKKKRLRAHEFYLKSLSLNDAQDMTHVKIGEIDDFYTRYNDALNHFLRAIELNNENHRALLGAARIYGVLGNKESADSFFAKAYSINKDKSAPILKEADKLYAAKKYSQAIEEYKRAQEINPADTELYYTIESLERLRENNNGSLAVLERLVYLRPLESKGWIRLAYTYLSERSYKNRRGELRQAARAVEKAIALSPGNMEYHSLAVEIYNALGDRKQELKHRSIINAENP